MEIFLYLQAGVDAVFGKLPENISWHELEERRGGRDHRPVGIVTGREALYV